MKRRLRNNGLSITLGMLFLIFWAAQAVAGWKVQRAHQALVGQSLIPFRAYLTSGHFWGATGENWESEFLQMGAYVMLTCFLFQKGSSESKDPDKACEPCDKPSRRSWLYRNSLSIAFAILFILSFIIHATGGLAQSNAERAERHLPPESLTEFLNSAEFWFQSFQNWQSEFLAVLSIVFLSIYFRQQGSPESKGVDEPDDATG